MNVELASSLPQGSQVELVGHFESVFVLAAEIRISIPAGLVGMLEVSDKAKNAAIELGAEAVIADLVLNAVTEVLGQGTVQKATVNEGAAGSKFAKAPGQLGSNAAHTVLIAFAGGGGGSSGGGLSKCGEADIALGKPERRSLSWICTS